MLRSLVCIVSLVCATVPVLADKNVTIEPKIAKVGSPMVNESFDGELAEALKGSGRSLMACWLEKSWSQTSTLQ